MTTATRQHNVNPATGRCVMCGRNEWNRQRVLNCDYEQPRPEQGSGEGDESWGNAIADAAERLTASITPEFKRDYYAEFQQQQTAKYPAKVLAELLAAGEINREQYERLRRESVEHEHDAPAAPERGEWSYHEGQDYIVVLGGEHDTTDNPIANVYEVQLAQQIVTEHNQHSTLVEQRERLVTALKDLVRQLPTDERLADFNLDLAESVLTTIEQEPGREGQR